MAEHALRKVCEVFGFDSLNKYQEEALRFVFESKSDVFVNLPTGFGKSVVFQALPIVYSCVEPTRENIVIVVSPLINLMKDQVSRLTSLGINAISVIYQSVISAPSQTLEQLKGELIPSCTVHRVRSWLGKTRWRKMLSNDVYLTRETIFEVLLMNSPHVVTESPNKANISYVVQYMGKKQALQNICPG